MENNYNYKFERYTTAFIDYKLESEKFHEAIFNISRNGTNTVEPIEQFARILDIKYAHFRECAKRLLASNNVASELPSN